MSQKTHVCNEENKFFVTDTDIELENGVVKVTIWVECAICHTNGFIWFNGDTSSFEPAED